MKRTRITPEVESFPAPLRPFLQGASLYDSSSSRLAQVIFADKEGGYYLKSAPRGSLLKEAEMTRFFHSKGLGAPVLEYLSDAHGRDWLLTARIPGEACTHPMYLADPTRLCDLLANVLRELHETDPQGCPVPDRTAEYLSTVDAGYRAGKFDPAYLPEHLQHLTARRAWGLVDEHRHLLGRDTLLHGDYCLPNIMLDGWKFSGFVDPDGGGVGDRHIDLFWGMWSLAYNLKTHAYGARFLDAYGRDRVNADLLEIIAAAETFG